MSLNIEKSDKTPKIKSKLKEKKVQCGFMLKKDYLIKTLVDKRYSNSSSNIFSCKEYEDCNKKLKMQTIQESYYDREKKFDNFMFIRNLSNLKTERSDKLAKRSTIVIKKSASVQKVLGEEKSLTGTNNSPKPNKNYTKIKFPKLTLKPKNLNIHEMKNFGSFNSFVDTNVKDFRRISINSNQPTSGGVNSPTSNFSQYTFNINNLHSDINFNKTHKNITSLSPTKLKLVSKIYMNTKEFKDSNKNNDKKYIYNSSSVNLLSSTSMNTKESFSQTPMPAKAKNLISFNNLEQLSLSKEFKLPDQEQLQKKLKNKIIKNLLNIDKNTLVTKKKKKKNITIKSTKIRNEEEKINQKWNINNREEDLKPWDNDDSPHDKYI